MSPGPVATERVYRQLRLSVIEGVYAPGAILPLHRIADDIGTSVSPVRDAVHRLVGEGLLAPANGGGFAVPSLSGADVRDLYAWHAMVVRLALRTPWSRLTVGRLDAALAPGDNPAVLARSAATIFDVIAAGAGNAEIIRAITGAAARLHTVRLCEPNLIKGMRAELDSVIDVTCTGSVVAIRNAVIEYHRRRLRRSIKIAALLDQQRCGPTDW